MTNKKKRPDYSELRFALQIASALTFETFTEIAIAGVRGVLPISRALYVGMGLSILFYIRLDQSLLTRLHLSRYVAQGSSRFLISLALPVLPFYLWGLSSVRRRIMLKQKMKHLFQSLGLETKLKEFPKVLSDEPIDEFTRKIKFLSRGIPTKRYLEKRAEIESMLNASIVKLSNPFARRDVVELVYSFADMPTFLKLESIEAYHNFSFPIGQTWGRELTASLIDVPHFLIAGESGGGKSSFISMMTTVLLAKNEDLGVVLVDMKGGVQSRLFENTKKVRVAYQPSDVAEILNRTTQEMIDRMNLFKDANVRSLEDYNRKLKGRGPRLNRILLVIDEFSELVPKISSGDRMVLSEIIKGVAKIARMGRAAGIHLVVGIQKPDANNLDPGIKANLSGILCFPVTHFSQSTIVLGNGRAAELNSEIKGRAIWKHGIEQKEVQTAFVPESDIESFIKNSTSHLAKDGDENVISFEGRSR